MKLFTTLLLLGGLSLSAHAQGYYQIPNSDFENWDSDEVPSTDNGAGWHSFETATGILNTMKGSAPKPSKVVGVSGNAIKIYSKKVVLANANGNLTTGLINMGNMQATSTSNYNFSDTDNASGCLPFAGRPDAVEFYAKFKSGGSPNGRVQIFLHDNVEYRDPEIDSQSGNKVGSVAVFVPETDEWTKFSGEFTYLKDTPAEQFLLASATTNPTPGGSKDDEFYIDELKLIYYHELSSLQYDGKEILSGDQTDYDLSNETFEQSKLKYTVKGQGATAGYSYDAATGVYTLTVYGNDISVNEDSKTEYRIAFKAPEPVVTNYTNDLTVSVNNVTTEPQSTTVQLINEVDGSTSFQLKNFVLGDIPVGNIFLENVTVNGNKYSFNGTIDIAAGDDPAYSEDQWIGPGLSLMSNGIPVKLDATIEDNKMSAQIDIDMSSTLGEVIKVILAENQTLTPETAITTNANLANYTFTRTFPAGWSTLCLPFTTTAEVTAQQFTGATDNTLNFTKVAPTSGSTTMLEANVPYLVYFDAEQEVNLYYGGTIDAKPTAVEHGGFAFKGNYTPNFSMEGLYGVADVDGSQKIVRGTAGAALASTGAYFTAPANLQAAAYAISFDGDTTTGIDGATVTTVAETAVYNLQGVKVADSTKNLPAGLYIANGRKFIVK